MHLSESVYFTVQSCSTTFELWKTLSETYEKKVASTKMYMIRHLYNLRMKEFDSVQTHLNQYESLSSQTTIEDELRAMFLMSSLPSSWEIFVTTMCNASITAVKYSDVASSAILTEVARRKSFAKDSTDEAYVVKGSSNRPNKWGRSSSRPPTNQRSRSKSRDNRNCNYCKKPEHIKADCRALKAKSEKAQRVYHKGSRQEEVNYIDA